MGRGDFRPAYVPLHGLPRRTRYLSLRLFPKRNLALGDTILRQRWRRPVGRGARAALLSSAGLGGEAVYSGLWLYA